MSIGVRQLARYDVLIVGTRCAGAPLAMLLARKGYNVLGVDRAQFPSDTVSTHFMWPRTTASLAKWGLLDKLAETGCPMIDQVTADYGAIAIRGRPSPVDGTAAMFSPRRTVLDNLLVDAARQAGAEMREMTTFRELIWAEGRVVGARLQNADGRLVEESAAVVVGADGMWSPVARAAGATADVAHPSFTCGYYAYWAGVPTQGVEFYVRQGRDILVFPTHDGLTCIWAGRSHDDWDKYRTDVEGNYLDIIGLAPSLAERLKRSEQVTSFKGTSKLLNFYRQSFGKGWALVGDAAYHRDPLPGMGIGDAFLGAQLLADALAAGLADDPVLLDSSLVAYQSTFRCRTMPIFEYTLKAASLKDPTSAVPIYQRVAKSDRETTRFMDVLAGDIPFKEFFNPQNIERLLA
jgi:2-polyprenyl-6-methoxyphenol hydroxylase-like FAD-dependent oxidoreductase